MCVPVSNLGDASPPPPLLSAQTGEDVAKSLGRAWGCGSSRHDSDAAQIKGP